MKTISNIQMTIFSFLFLIGVFAICLKTTWCSIPSALWQPVASMELQPSCPQEINFTGPQQTELKKLLDEYLSTLRSICSFFCQTKDATYKNQSIQEQLFNLKKIVAKLEDEYSRLKNFYMQAGCCPRSFEKNHYSFLEQLVTPA